jgi:hypothetical protein
LGFLADFATFFSQLFLDENHVHGVVALHDEVQQLFAALDVDLVGVFERHFRFLQFRTPVQQISAM